VHTDFGYLYVQNSGICAHMTTFIISATERNRRFAEFLKKLGIATSFIEREDKIQVELPAGFHLLRASVEDAVGNLTDIEWRNLIKEIKRTVKGARVIADNLRFQLVPYRTQRLFLRISPIERGLIKRAAEIEHRSISDFVREATLEKADSVLVVSERQKKEEKPRAKQETEFG
jgi:hypothetical protein